MQFELGDERSSKAPYDEISPASVYRIKLARTSREDAKEQLALAAYAFDNGHWDDTRLGFILAENADKKQG